MSDDDKRYERLTYDEAAEELVGYRKKYPIAEMLDAQSLEKEEYCLFSGPSCPCMRKVCEEVLRDKRERTEFLHMGDVHHKASARYLEVDGEPRVLLFARPLTTSDDSVSESLLYEDALTKAFNRRYYEERLRHRYLAAGIAIMDLDDFKLINDTYGHRAGDLAIKTVVDAVLDCMGDNDLLVRYGGDEFIAVLQGVTVDDFSARLSAIGERVYSSLVPGYQQIQLSLSIGGVLSAGRTVEDAVHQADKLMYRAKRRKSCVVTDSDEIDEPSTFKPLLLIVDDSEMNREILHDMLEDEYEIVEAASGEECIHILENRANEISIVLLDIIMPGMSGFDVLLAMARNNWIDDTPVVMISSEDSEDVVLRTYELGASDYVSRPFDTRVVRHRVSNVVRLYAKQRRLTALLVQQFYEQERNSRMLVDVLSGVMELRNGESGAHVHHIGALTELLLERLVQKSGKYSIPGSKRSMIAMASALHDIGKMAIDDKILNKPGKLTDEEFAIMKTHAALGAEMLEKLDQYKDSALVKIAIEICHWHHERYDGGGYPDGLVGDEIPISAQVVSIADVYDALTAKRVYKDAIAHEEAIRMILDGECGQFNPLLLECLVDVKDRIAQVISTSEVTPPPIHEKVITSNGHVFTVYGKGGAS